MKLPRSMIAGSWVRLALGVTFLSSVMDRLGLLGAAGHSGVSWGDFSHFLTQVAAMNWFLPSSLIPLVGWTETVAEGALGLLLLIGLRTRAVAGASGILLLLFAIELTFSYGPKSAIDYSVWSASAAAILLMQYPKTVLSLDNLVGHRPQFPETSTPDE